MAFDPKLRSDNERPLFIIGVVVSVMAYAALVISIIGALYGALILAFVLIGQALFLAHVRGNGLRLSEAQLPGLYARCKGAAEKLGLAAMPEVYLVQSHGILNAFATKLLSRRFVIINSALADACADPRQLDFVIGHELGHLAAGHLAWNALLLPFHLVPWLGTAYSRAREYTCDRAGMVCCGGLEPAMRGLAVLAAGGRSAAELDLPTFMAQRYGTGAFWMAVLELNSTHPYLCKRAAALQEFTTPGSVKPVPRTPLAYPLAPVFGFASAGAGAAPIMMVAVIGMLAAIAIPNFKKMQERAQQAALHRQQQEQHSPRQRGVNVPVAPNESADAAPEEDQPARR
jgi:Zn-dependent protease with chaperone function